MFRIESCSFLANKANYVDIMRNLKKEFYNLSVQPKQSRLESCVIWIEFFASCLIGSLRFHSLRNSLCIQSEWSLSYLENE